MKTDSKICDMAANRFFVQTAPDFRFLCWVFPIAISVILVSLCSRNLSADDRLVSELLPETVAVYAEISAPAELIDRLKRHERLIAAVDAPPVQQLLSDPDVFKLRAGIGLAEVMLGASIEEVIKSLAADGICIAVDRETQGIVVITKSVDSEYVDRYVKTILKIVRKDAEGKGNPDPFKSAVHRGISAYQIDKIAFAAVDEYLIITSKGELGKNIIDRILDDTEDSLAKNDRFIAARTGDRDNEAEFWAYADIIALRDEGVGKGLFRGRADDFFGELLLGGVLANLHQTRYATGMISVNDSGLHVQLQSPHDPAWIGQEREFYVGKNGDASALPLLQPDNTIFSLSTYRDISEMWLRAGDLFDAKVNDQLAVADSTLATLFSGRDFGEDILGAIDPELRIVAARQQYSAENPIPAIKLPSFALVAKLREPDKMQPELRRIFQSLIGFLNVVGAMNGQPQLDLDMDKTDEMQMVMARYVPDVDRKSNDDAVIQYNFSPCLTFVGDNAIVSSSIDLASQLANVITEGQPTDTTTDAINTAAQLSAPELNAILTDNRGQLEAQNMLEKGHTKSQARREISRLLDIISLFSDAKLAFRINEKMSVDLQVSLLEVAAP